MSGGSASSRRWTRCAIPPNIRPSALRVHISAAWRNLGLPSLHCDAPNPLGWPHQLRRPVAMAHPRIKLPRFRRPGSQGHPSDAHHTGIYTTVLGSTTPTTPERRPDGRVCATTVKLHISYHQPQHLNVRLTSRATPVNRPKPTPISLAATVVLQLTAPTQPRTQYADAIGTYDSESAGCLWSLLAQVPKCPKQAPPQVYNTGLRNQHMFGGTWSAYESCLRA